jgi:hypothetical protein
VGLQNLFASAARLLRNREEKSSPVNGFAVTTQWFLAGVPTGWQIEATPDVDGNNVNSVLWSNIVTGAQVIWTSNGSALLPEAPFALVNPAWTVQP